MNFSNTAISLIPVHRRFRKRMPVKRAWPMMRPFQILPATIEVAEETGPLSPLCGKRVIVVADAQNLDRGARDLGFKMSWALLGEKIDAAAASASRHVILSQHPGDERRMNYFTERDWIPHATQIRTVSTKKGLKRKGNADFLMSFLAGVLVSRSSADVVVLASGDGDLVEEIAIGIRSLLKERSIVTMSLAGSTAGRLNAEKNALIYANIEIGKDCLRQTFLLKRKV
jgi:hypothetical protein